MNALNDILSADLSLRWLWAQVPVAWRGLVNWWRSEFLDLLPESLVAWLGGTAGPVVRLGVETNGVRVEGLSATGRMAHSGTIAWDEYSVAALDRHLSRIGLKR